MTDRNLVCAIIDLAMFLEQSDDQTVDADAAVNALENLAAHLQAMDNEVKNQFAKTLLELAPTYGQHSPFVEEFASNFGLQD